MTHLWLHEPDSCTSPPPHGPAVQLQQKWTTLLISYMGAKTGANKTQQKSEGAYQQDAVKTVTS